MRLFNSPRTAHPAGVLLLVVGMYLAVLVAPTLSGTSAGAREVPMTVDVIERVSWGGVSGAPGRHVGQVDEVIVHHFWRPALNEVAAPPAEIELLQRVDQIHARRGWDGIGYNFIVFQSGRVYEGRGWERGGAHTKGRNADSLGIAFAMDGDTHHPSSEAWQAAKDLIEDGVNAGHLDRDVTISGHRDHAEKSCPGENLVPRLPELRPEL